MTLKEAKTARRSTHVPKSNRLGAHWLGRTLTWLSTLTIVVLSIVPPSLRPITPLPHKREHFAIFMMWGIAFGLGYRIHLIYQLVWAVLFAGAIEFAQFWVPGRHARISDLVVDAEAACVGILCARILSGWLTIWLNPRRQYGLKGAPSTHNQPAQKDVKTHRSR
jgi:VanZ family protein